MGGVFMLGKTNVKKWKTFEKTTIKEPVTKTRTVVEHAYAGAWVRFESSGNQLFVTTSTNWAQLCPQIIVHATTVNIADWRITTTNGVKTAAPQIWFVNGFTAKFPDGRLLATGPSYVDMGSIVTGSHVETYTDYIDKEVIKEVWHPWWVKNKG